MARRAPDPEHRQRDAERSRARLLEAALDEFAAKGYAGARVSDIAARAGVNTQLISYYFGGKRGLYRELERSWQEREARFAEAGLPLRELVVRYLHAALEDPRATRLLAWQGLDGAGDGEPEPDGDDAAVADLARRQQDGELAADLDPGFVLLAFMGALTGPVIMPQVARRSTGLDPSSPEFERRYAEQLRRMIDRLAGKGRAGSGRPAAGEEQRPSPATRPV